MRALVFALLLVSACARPERTAYVPPSGGPWLTRVELTHPLVGRVYDPKARAFLMPDVLSNRIVSATHLLLGEKHDNPDHHRLQARALRQLVRAKRTPALVLEMFDADEQASIDVAWSTAGPERFGALVGWQRRGWPSYEMYRPLFDVAKEHGLRLYGGNLPHAVAKAVAKTGRAAMPSDLQTSLGLDTPLGDAEQRALERDIADAHCGQLPEASLPSMALAQRARDAHLAKTLAQFSDAVLIAGASHVRVDRGVPMHLAKFAPNARVLSLAWVEVQPGLDTPESYAVVYGASELPFDIVWFTPRLSHEDPCGAFVRR